MPIRFSAEACGSSGDRGNFFRCNVYRQAGWNGTFKSSRRFHWLGGVRIARGDGNRLQSFFYFRFGIWSGNGKAIFPSRFLVPEPSLVSDCSTAAKVLANRPDF